MSTQQKHVLSLYALPDGSDHNAAEIDTPDWESSVLYEKDQANHAYLQMTHAVAWAIVGDFSDGYAVAYWKLDEEGYSACMGIRTIKCNDLIPAPSPQRLRPPQATKQMKTPETLDEAAEILAETFRLITKPEAKPKVTLVGRDEKDRVVIAVGFRGDKLIQAMQVEAFVIDNGDSIRFRSQIKDGNTILVYQMEKKPA